MEVRQQVSCRSMPLRRGRQGTPRVCRGRDSTGAMRRPPPLIPLSAFVLLLYLPRTVGTLSVDFVGLYGTRDLNEGSCAIIPFGSLSLDPPTRFIMIGPPNRDACFKLYLIVSSTNHRSLRYLITFKTSTSSNFCAKS